MSDQVFWKSKTLTQMNKSEWESLCDGCGKCCLHKLQDEDTEELAFTCIRCQFLDPDTCRCSVYSERLKFVPECLNLRPEDLHEVSAWLPSTCAYKLIFEGQELPDWHHLVSGDCDLIHVEQMSVKGKTICETMVDEDHWFDYIVE